MVSNIANTNSPICTLLNGFKHCNLMLKILFNVNHLFQVTVKEFEIKQWIKLFYLTHRRNLNRYYHSWSEWTWEWKGTLHSLKLWDWSLTIRCSLVSFSEHLLLLLLVGEGLTPLLEMLSTYFTAPTWLSWVKDCELQW